MNCPISLRKNMHQNLKDVLEVIPEEKASEEGQLVGYSDNYLKVQFEGSTDLIGSIVKVKITKAGYPINEGLL